MHGYNWNRMNEPLQNIIDQLWIAPANAEWIPKTDVILLSDIRRWMGSGDIEVQGFTHGLLHDRRFRIEPPITLEEYIVVTKLYYERCLRENPEGDWADSRYAAGADLVNIFASLWRDSSVPREVLQDLKAWLGNLYKDGDSDLRTCIVQATLEHLFEQEPIRALFSDWLDDPVLAEAHREASEWYKGGGSTPLGKLPFGPDEKG